MTRLRNLIKAIVIFFWDLWHTFVVQISGKYNNYYEQPWKVNKYSKALKPIYIKLAENYPLRVAAKAINAWNAFAGTKLFTLNANKMFYKVNVVPEIKGSTQGLWTGSSIDIEEDEVNNVALLIHEMGHSLGFEHTQDPTSYMFPVVFPSAKFTMQMKKVLEDNIL